MAGSGCDVLVIEDNPADAYLIRAALHAALRCDVVVVDHGDEALRLIRGTSRTGRWCPALLVLDLNLPAMSGKELLREMRAYGLCPDTPVLVCTSTQREQDLEAVRRLRVGEIVMKSNDPDKYGELGDAALRLLGKTARTDEGSASA